MANPFRQRLMAAIPGVLDHTADQIEAFMSQLGGLHQAVCANAVPAELSDEFEMGSSSIASSGTADDATKEVVTSLKDILGMHTDQADSQVVDSVLRHGRLRSALLQLLVFTVRWERLTQQTSQQPITASDVEQLQPLTSTAEEENGRQCTAGPACGSVLSCRFFLLGILSSMLKTGAEQLTDPNSARTGAGSGVVQRLGSRRRFGAAAATTLEPGGPSASDGPPLSLLALDLGCALLRMHTLQCCSRQVAAVCAWMGGDGEEQLQQEQQQQEEEQQRAQGEEQQQQQQQQQQPSRQREEEDEQQRTGAGAGQEQGLERRDGAGEFLGVVQSSTLLIDGLLALAQAAMGVLGRGEGLVSAQGATAAAAQHADLRRLSRRFLLLFASHLRDSHLLEHCARAAVMAAVGRRAVGAAGGSSASGEAAEGPGQGQAQAQGQGQGLERVPSGSGPDILHVLVHDLMFLRNDAKGLVKDCMQAPAPASTLIGPAVRQALTGPAFVHLNLVLGLHALCTADGGPEYGMPVSYRALPVAWKVGRTINGVKRFTADLEVILMVQMLRQPELRERCLDLLGGVGPMLALLLRACELAAGSVEVHVQQEEEQRGRGQGERGEEAGRTLRYAMDPKAAVDIGHQAHLAAHQLLVECWEEQQEQQLDRRAAAQGARGSGGHEAAGAGRSSQLGVQGHEASSAEEPAGLAGAPAAGERDGEERAAGAAPGAAAVGSAGGGEEREGPGAAAVNARVPPGGTAGAAALAATADGASDGGVAAGVGSGEPPGAAGAGGAAEPPAAVQAAGALPHLGQRVSGPGRGSRRPLSPAALQAFQVRWWRCVCRAAEHVVTLRLGVEEREAEEALHSSLVGWLRLEELGLPDAVGGPWPPAAPPRLAAALDGGLLPCLERLTRRAAKDPEGNVSDMVQDVLYSTQTSRGVRKWGDLLWLLAYGESGQSMGFLSALTSLLPQPAWGGGGGGRSGGGGNMSRRGPKGGPKDGEVSYLSVRAMTASCAFIGSGFELRTQSDGGSEGSEGSGGNTPRATCPPGVPPPGRWRLQHMLAHAARLLLPLLARFACCQSIYHGSVDKHSRAASSTLVRDLVAVTFDPLLRWIMGLSLVGLDGSGGGNSSVGGGSAGSRSGCAIWDNNDAACGAGCSGSTGGRAIHNGTSALGDAGGGGERAASQGLEQQQRHQVEERKGALQSVHGSALRRFLFEEVQAVEVLGTVLRHLPSLTGISVPALVRALCFLTAAYPDEVWRRVTGAAQGCKGGGSRSEGSSARGGGGARKQRGASGAGAGCSSQPGSVWPVERVRGLGPVLRAETEEGGAGEEENRLRAIAAASDTLAGLLEAWRDGSAGEGQEGTGNGEGEKGGSGRFEQLRVAIGRMDGVAATTASMARALYEVLSAPATPLVA